jgi:hypothetical protein
MAIDTIATWHRLVQERNPRGLNDLLADDAVFHSPVVHTRKLARRSPVLISLPLSTYSSRLMLRPLKAVNLIHQKMAAMLQAQAQQQ